MTTLTIYTPEGTTLLDTAEIDYKGWHMFVVDRLGGSGMKATAVYFDGNLKTNVQHKVWVKNAIVEAEEVKDGSVVYLERVAPIGRPEIETWTKNGEENSSAFLIQNLINKGKIVIEPVKA